MSEVFLDNTFELINQIHEPQKIVVPKFVAEWIEEFKKSRSNLAWVWEVYPNESKIKNWLESNTEKFMWAWLFGYEIEREKLYTVRIPDPNRPDTVTFLYKENGKVFIGSDIFLDEAPSLAVCEGGKGELNARIFYYRRLYKTY